LKTYLVWGRTRRWLPFKFLGKVEARTSIEAIRSASRKLPQRIALPKDGCEECILKWLRKCCPCPLFDWWSLDFEEEEELKRLLEG